jgi:hypothetical protein
MVPDSTGGKFPRAVLFFTHLCGVPREQTSLFGVLTVILTGFIAGNSFA